MEILKTTKNAYLFNGLKFIAISPLFILKIIEKWAVSSFPEMSSFYTGGMGTIVVALEFVLCLVVYMMTASLRDGRTSELKDNVLLKKISDLPLISNLATIVINSNYTKALRRYNQLKMVGEKIGPKEFLVKKCIYAIAGFLALNIVMFYKDGREKAELVHNFEQAYENSYISSEEQRNAMKELSKSIMETYKGRDIESSSATIKKELVDGGIKKANADLVIAELIARNNKYKDTYYHWTYLLLAIVAMAIGFFIPNGLLYYQTMIVKKGMEDEVVQFQTLALILMHVDGVTIDVLLEWMERFAYCFRDSITECIINLERSNEDAIQTMQDSESFPAFKRFCDNIANINSVGMVSAFDEIESERDYYRHKREQDNNMAVENKASIGRIISFIPLMGAILGYMIYPFIQFFDEMNSQLTQAINSF